MHNPLLAGEDLFFDSFDYLAASFHCTSSEDTLAKDTESEFETFGCEVWTSELRSICERRHNFLHKMGFDDLMPSEMCFPQIINHEDLVESLEHVQFDLETVPFPGASSGSQKLELDPFCKRSLCSEKVFDSHELDRNGVNTFYEDVDTCERMRSGMAPGPSHYVHRPTTNEGHRVGRKDAQIYGRKNSFRSWLKDLLVRRQSGEHCEYRFSTHSAQVHKTGRTRVQCHGKQRVEFGVLMNQDFQAHKGSISVMKFSPDGRYLATGGEDCIVRVWLVAEVETSFKHLSGDCMNKFADNFKQHKLFLRKKGLDSAPIFIPKKTFKLEETPLHQYCGHANDVLDLSWSKSNCLLTSSKDKTVRMWQVGRDHCLGIFPHNNYVTCVQFNPVDEGYFLSGSIDGKVRIWEISKGRVSDWVDIGDIVTAACFQPDGQGLLVGSIIGSCRFYNLSDNGLQLDAELNILGKRKNKKGITSFQFIPEDPEKIMITSLDSKVRIASKGDVIHEYRGLRKSRKQLSASFTSNGKYIVSVGEDSRVYIWNYFPGSPSSKARRLVNSFEYFFSKDASIAVPWPGVNDMESGPWNKYSHFQSKKISQPLSGTNDPESSCLGAWFFSDFPSRSSATWPEEKLGRWAEDAGALVICPCAGHGCLDHLSLKLLSPAYWGQVIVTAGHDGAIRSFHSYELPVGL